MKRFIKTSCIIVFFFGLVVLVSAASTGHILGRITEKESGQPVAFVTIVFENKMSKMEVLTNEYGFYYASYIPTGRYQMRTDYNGRTFFMENIRVMDSYSNVMDFSVSMDSSLPVRVELQQQPPAFTSVASTDIILANNTFNQPTRTLEEALSMQPGLDVINGKLYVKGSDDVRFFIDGTPVLGQPRLGRGW